MFTYEQIQSLNQLEIEVYNYVLVHMKKVMHMKIRELAADVHVSTTTILRFCSKMGCDGYAEFKWQLKEYLAQAKEQVNKEDFTLLENFMKQVQQEAYDTVLDRIANMIVRSEYVFFFGIGSSGTLGKYGARFLSDIGKYTQYIDDPFYPSPNYDGEKTTVIVLSVSGESREVIEQVEQYKRRQVHIVSITNSANCTVAKMADISLTYYMPFIKLNREYNVTTQVPLVLLLEMIGHKVQEKLLK